MSVLQASAVAPASVGNVGVGFDILGHSVFGAGDRVSVRRTRRREVRIAAIRNTDFNLPMDAGSNTAGAALISLSRALGLDFGLEVEIDKGIALGSGMGGSAASCVAALVAANALLDAPLSREALYPHALAGEAVASGGLHGDNLGAMLLGGLVLATATRLERIQVPDAWHCALVHPHAVLETRRAREALKGMYLLPEFIAQSANLAMLLAGCYQGDASLVRSGLNDVLIEPRRERLIVGFRRVKAAALDCGAMGASISGAGPSVFAWCESREAAQAASRAMQAAFADAGFAADALVSAINGPAAAVVA